MHQISHTYIQKYILFQYFICIFFLRNSISFTNLLLLMNCDVIYRFLIGTKYYIIMIYKYCISISNDMNTCITIIILSKCLNQSLYSIQQWRSQSKIVHFPRVSFFFLTRQRYDHWRLFFMTSALLVTFLASHYQIR